MKRLSASLFSIVVPALLTACQPGDGVAPRSLADLEIMDDHSVIAVLDLYAFRLHHCDGYFTAEAAYLGRTELPYRPSTIDEGYKESARAVAARTAMLPEAFPHLFASRQLDARYDVVHGDYGAQLEHDGWIETSARWSELIETCQLAGKNAQETIASVVASGTVADRRLEDNPKAAHNLALFLSDYSREFQECAAYWAAVGDTARSGAAAWRAEAVMRAFPALLERPAFDQFQDQKLAAYRDLFDTDSDDFGRRTGVRKVYCEAVARDERLAVETVLGARFPGSS